MKQRMIIGAASTAAVITIITFAAMAMMSSSRMTSQTPNSQNTTGLASSTIQVVAAENFWGSLASQLGGSHVQVLSILTDPNADPHEYETNAADARAFSNVAYVIVNGAGYDNWASKLLAAGNHPNQKVLNVADLLGKKEGDNPHFWYNPRYVDTTVNQMYRDLVSIDPADTGYYAQRYVNLNQSLTANNAMILEIRQQFAGTRVASTEDIFVYLSDAMGLNLVSPPEFMQAVTEGNDPPVRSVTEFHQILENKSVTLLVYNTQTVTPTTENIRSLAKTNDVSIVGISETVQPANLSYQDWMNGEIVSIQNALKSKTSGQ